MTASRTGRVRRHISQLDRMLNMKSERLDNYTGRSDSFLRADIGALRFALRVIEGCQDKGVLEEMYHHGVQVSGRGQKEDPQ